MQSDFDNVNPKAIPNSKIGVAGYWFATNYGGVASYYSLYNKIKSLGYNPFLIENPYFETDKEGMNVFSRNFFISENCEIAKPLNNDDLIQLNNLANTFILGSDQVFTSSSIRAFGKLFLMEFANQNKKRIAYSASCGGDNLDADSALLDFAKNELNKFFEVSVREYSATQLIKNKFKINAPTLCDPIFFTSKNQFQSLGKKTDIVHNENYFLAYILDPTEDKKICIEKISKQLNLIPKIALDGRKFTHDNNAAKINMPNETLPELDFYQWLNYYSNASYVFTDSYHGAIMSLILNKPCIIYTNKGRGLPRFITLGKMFDIESRIIDSSKNLTEAKIVENINFDLINSKIKKEAAKGSEWLSNALVAKGLKKSVDFHLDLESACTGCGACFNSCPVGAIKMEPNKDGFLNPIIDRKKCIDCEICTKKCVALNQSYKNNENPDCLAVWADDKIREVSSSGGAFTVIANYVLSQKGVVYGAVFDKDFKVKHVAATNEKELNAMRGSKYYQSNIGDVFKQVETDLQKGKTVLFSGMPCQVAGLYSYLKKEFDNLITVDILCHGISSYKAFEKYRKDVLNNKKLAELYFKAKKPWGWHAGINAVFKDGSKYSKIIEEDKFFVSYINGLSKNTPCGQCKFNRLPRQGDITLGDFWKIQNYKKELNDNKGTSLVLINNEKGKKVFDKIAADFPVNEKVPISYAIEGNGIIKYPYALNPNRNLFFENLDNTDFSTLVDTYRTDKPSASLDKLNDNQKEFYYIAEIIKKNKGARKLVMWGENYSFRNFLSAYYGINAEFILTTNSAAVNGKTIRHFDEIKGKASQYYVFVIGKSFNKNDYQKFLDYGYVAIKDFVYRMINPIILENYDLSKGYSDSFGNIVEKSNGIIKKIIFRGYNNKINIKPNVWNLQNLSIDCSANCKIIIESHCNFTQPFTNIESRGYDGTSEIKIENSCIFMDSVLRVFTHHNNSFILINEHTTFGEQARLHANQGKKIIIGKDCMFSSYVTLFAGDGHTIMDVNEKRPLNLFNEFGHPKNALVLGNHVWVGYRSLIMAGTNVGDGSIIGAQTTLKGKYPNNTSIAGSPARELRRDVAWSRDMIATDINSCGEYANKTSTANAPISGKNVLVIGGTRFMGIQLVKELLKLGNKVTIATRGKTKDYFDDNIKRITFDINDSLSAKKNLSGLNFDIVFDNLAYCSNNVKNVLDNVKCDRYIQLSSIAVYPRKELLTENDFHPEKIKHEWCDFDDWKKYGPSKKQAEATICQKYPDTSYVIVRIPYVTPTDRLNYYFKHISEGIPMRIKNTDIKMTFVRDSEVGKFLPWIAAQNYTGTINLSSCGYVKLSDIISYMEKRTNKKAVISNEGDESPFNEDSFSLSMDKAVELGYRAVNINDWFWSFIDHNVK